MKFKLVLNGDSISSKILYVSILLFAATLPVAPILLNNIAAIALVLSWLMLLAQKKVRVSTSNALYFYIFISLFVVYAFGATYSTNIREAMWQLEIMFLLFILPLILGTIPSITPKNINHIFIVFASSNTIIVLLCIIGTLVKNYNQGIELAPHNAWYFSSESLVQGFGFHPNYMAIYSLFTILILIQLLCGIKQRIKITVSILIVCVIILHILFIAILSARTQMMILLLLGLLWIGYYAVKYNKIKTGILLGILCISIVATSISLSPILKEKFKGLFGINVDNDNKKFNSDLRLQKWESAYNIFKENLVLGVGTGDMQERLQLEYQRNNYNLAYNLRYTAHNQYLDIAGRLGIIGLASLLACLLYPMIISIKTKDIFYFSFLLIISISFIPEMVLTLNKGVAFYAFFNSILAFHIQKYSSSKPHITSC